MLNVWFLNVGHGDCTIIEHPSGRLTMVDINNSQSYDAETQREILAEGGFQSPLVASLFGSSLLEETTKNELVDPIKFYKDRFGDRPLFRFVLTHPDLDHMRGLKKLLANVRILNFWDTNNTKPTPTFNSNADREDWTAYQDLRAGLYENVTVRQFTRGDSAFALNRELDGTIGGDGIDVLSPTPTLVAACNAQGKSNDLSIVLRLQYAGTRIVLPGDAEDLAWNDMVTHFGDELKADVLKASHHGRDSGYHLEALQRIRPEVSILSVGRKPNTDAHSKYSYHCSSAWSTRRHGTIHLQVDSTGNRTWHADRNTS